MEKKIVTEIARNNKIGMLCHLIDIIIISIFFLLQALTDSSRLVNSIIVIALAIIPVIGEFIFYKKNHETTMVKHFLAIGFAILYTFILFTSTNPLVFTYVIPLLLVISIFNDTKYAAFIGSGVIIENLIVVILQMSTGKFGFINNNVSVIQFATVTLVSVYSIVASKTINTNSKQKMQDIVDAQNRTQILLNNISNLSNTTRAEITDITDQLEHLNSASKFTHNAMQEVSIGTTDTADAVQNQILQTEAIGQKVDLVTNAADKISENMEHTLQTLSKSNENIDLLSKKVDISVSNGADVANKLKSLNTYIDEMNSIIELISGITSQISLLALNASIEAARAGESGKGFAVVATEISKMATQTDEATLQITELINNTSSAIREVVDVIYQMIDGINEEKSSSTEVSKSFDEIQSNTYRIRDNVSTLSSCIAELRSANNVIVDSIQTISAISEEVSAHASETINAEEQNTQILDGISQKMQALVEIMRQNEV